MIVGECYICGKKARHVCDVCGRPVCDEHYVSSVGMCVRCALGKLNKNDDNTAP